MTIRAKFEVTRVTGGGLTFTIDNEALADEFKPGQAYYLDFTRADQ